MADLLQAARNKLKRISEDTEVIQQVVACGETFLSRTRASRDGLACRLESMGDFLEQAEEVLDDARDELDDRVHETRRLNDFILCGEALQLEGYHEPAQPEQARPQPPMARPVRVSAGSTQVERLVRSPVIDWIGLLAWVVLLGIALYDWTAR